MLYEGRREISLYRSIGLLAKANHKSLLPLLSGTQKPMASKQASHLID